MVTESQGPHNKVGGVYLDGSKVSVVIPTFNRPELLSRAIRSVLAQTYQDFEIIVVDDGDKESAGAVVSSFEKQNIRYIKNNPPKQGGGATRNRGIEEADGEYVAFLDDDDEWMPTKLEKQVFALDSSGVGASHCGLVVIDNATDKVVREDLPGESGVVDIFDRTLFRCYIWTSELVVRRALLLKEQFDPTFKKNQEWDLQLRLAKLTKFVAVNEVLVRLNVLGEDEHMGGSGNVKNIASGFERLLEKHHVAYAGAPKARARQRFMLAMFQKKYGDFENMKRNIAIAFKATPYNKTILIHYLLSRLGKKIYTSTIQLVHIFR